MSLRALCIFIEVAVLGLLIWALLQGRGVLPRARRSLATITIIQPHSSLPVHPPLLARPSLREVSRSATASIRSAAVPRQPPVASRPTAASNTPPTLNPSEIQQGDPGGEFVEGAGAGTGAGEGGLIIGGGGGDSGGECGRLYALGYLDRVNYAVAQRFKEDPTVNRYSFTARVRLWFGADGSVRQSEFETSTGDTRIDRIVVALLQTIDVRENVPECIQPISVQIALPANASNDKARGGESDVRRTQSSQTLIWQRPPPK